MNTRSVSSHQWYKLLFGRVVSLSLRFSSFRPHLVLGLGMNACDYVWALSMFIALRIIIVVKQFFLPLFLPLFLSPLLYLWTAKPSQAKQANNLEDNESFFFDERERLDVKMWLPVLQSLSLHASWFRNIFSQQLHSKSHLRPNFYRHSWKCNMNIYAWTSLWFGFEKMWPSDFIIKSLLLSPVTAFVFITLDALIIAEHTEGERESRNTICDYSRCSLSLRISTVECMLVSLDANVLWNELLPVSKNNDLKIYLKNDLS